MAASQHGKGCNKLLLWSMRNAHLKRSLSLKQWLVNVAQAVAEADKEGSHFGMGGVQVTYKEKAARAEIKRYLD